MWRGYIELLHPLVPVDKGPRVEVGEKASSPELLPAATRRSGGSNSWQGGGRLRQWRIPRGGWGHLLRISWGGMWAATAPVEDKERPPSWKQGEGRPLLQLKQGQGGHTGGVVGGQRHNHKHVEGIKSAQLSRNLYKKISKETGD